VSVHVYLKRAADFEGLNNAYRQTFTDKPPVRTTVVTDLGPDRLVALSAIAVPAGAPREVLHPPGWIKSPRPYSYIVRAGGLVFLSGLVSRRGTDDQPVPGPVSVQTKTILDNAGVLLRTAGLTYADVVAARVFLTDDSLFEEMNNQYRAYFTDEPPARATAITELMGLDAFVEITLIASESGKQALGPSVSPSLPLSTAVRAGDVLFLSGVLGNTDTNASDLTAQTREVFTRIRRTLEGAGLSFSHVVDNTIYLADMWQQRQVDAISREIFPHDPPARTVVGARLVARSAVVEMMMTAAGR
jgi:2-iminobutanoate/2-iminopropanoate deaminase